MENKHLQEYSEYLKDYFKDIKKGDKIVLTDLDGTMFRDSFFIKLYDEMLSEGWICDSDSKSVYSHYLGWKNREISYDEYLGVCIKAFFNGLKGNHEREVMKLVKRLLKKYSKRNYVFTLNKLNELKSKGYKIIIVSGTPDFIIKELVHEYGFDYGVGSVYAKNDTERFNGEFIIPMFSGKIKIMVLNMLREKKVAKIISFGDTNGDLPLLENSDEGYAINPNSELLKSVMDNPKIRVIVERKDVIYDFKGGKIVKLRN